MSKAIDNIVKAYSVKGETLASRVFAVGAARAEGMSTDDIIMEAHNSIAESHSGAVLDNFSASTLNNANTSFNLYVKNAGLDVPNATGIKGVFGRVATLIEQARSKHGKKIVADTFKEFLVSEYTSPSARAEHAEEILNTLVGLDAQGEDSRQKTPAERFIAALKTAERLLESAELDDAQAELAASILESLSDGIA